MRLYNLGKEMSHLVVTCSIFPKIDNDERERERERERRGKK